MSFVIVPIPTTAATLTATNVAATSRTAWNVATTYSSGDYCSAPDSAGIEHEYRFLPPAEVSPAPTSIGQNPKDFSVVRRSQMKADATSTDELYLHFWLDLGPSNRWAMFDGRSRAATSRADSIAVTVTPGQLFNSLALINVVGDAVAVTVNDPAAGEVFSYAADLIDLTGIVDYYTWCFAPRGSRGDVVLSDLPAYPQASITVTVSNPGETAEIGEMVIGLKTFLGIEIYGGKLGYENYSEKARDESEIATISPGEYYQTYQYDLSIETGKIKAVYRALTGLYAAPAVFVGNQDLPETIIYGLMSDFSVVRRGPVRSSCSITVEEIS